MCSELAVFPTTWAHVSTGGGPSRPGLLLQLARLNSAYTSCQSYMRAERFEELLEDLRPDLRPGDRANS